MAYQVLWQKLSFQPIDPAEPTVPTGPPELVLRGELVPSYVPQFTINALLNAGMVVPVADRPDPAIVPMTADPMPAVGPDTPIVLPDGTSTINNPSGPDAGTPAAQIVRPKPGDSRDKWETYAASPAVGMDLGEAEAMPNKAALIAEVERIEAESADPDEV